MADRRPKLAGPRISVGKSRDYETYSVPATKQCNCNNNNNPPSGNSWFILDNVKLPKEVPSSFSYLGSPVQRQKKDDVDELRALAELLEIAVPTTNAVGTVMGDIQRTPTIATNVIPIQLPSKKQ